MKKQNKWLDNFGKADNANESNVSMSDDFVGLAYDTSGRNYSPAWKGQFQTGGTLPGSPGFMYARTVNPAPSEGKYAKKTMPSAQKGKEIQKQKYTESTLENIFEIFDPTGISSWNDVAASYMDTGMSDETKLEIFGALPLLGKVGKAGKYLSKVAKNQAIPSLLRATPYVGRGTDAVQAVQQYQSAPLLPSAPPAEVGQFGRYAGMGKMQNGGEMKFYQEGLDWKPKSMQEGGKIYEGQELPEFFMEGKDERIKEAMSQGIRKFYGHVGELMDAPQKEMMQFITGKEQTPSEAWGFQQPGAWLDSYSSFGKNLSNFGIDAFIDPVNAIPGVGLVDDLTRGAVRGAAQDAVSKTLKYGVSPYSYSPEVLFRIPENLTRVALGKPKALPKAVTEVAEKNPKTKRTIEDTYSNREDAWSVYLGLPPENKGLKLVGLDEATGLSKYELTKPRVMSPDAVKDYKEVIDRSTFSNPSKIYLDLNQPGDKVVDSDKIFGVMGGYSKFVSPDGKSIMYRDVWDLQPFSRLNSKELPTNMIGNAIRNFEVSSLIPGARPFVSEGKLADIKTKYYPAKNYKNITSRYKEALDYSSEIYPPEAFVNDVDNPSPEEIFKYDQFLRDKTKEALMQEIKYEKTFLNPTGWNNSKKYADFAPYIKVDKSKKKEGGVIKDNRGQWDHPGEITEIDSPYITMQGVPYNVLGVSDEGDTKLMEPGKDYKFKGKKVTEFPVAKLGINDLDAQPKKKLNQLLNFTNNPDKDWLKKYQ